MTNKVPVSCKDIDVHFDLREGLRLRCLIQFPESPFTSTAVFEITKDGEVYSERLSGAPVHVALSMLRLSLTKFLHQAARFKDRSTGQEFLSLHTKGGEVINLTDDDIPGDIDEPLRSLSLTLGRVATRHMSRYPYMELTLGDTKLQHRVSRLDLSRENEIAVATTDVSITTLGPSYILNNVLRDDAVSVDAMLTDLVQLQSVIDRTMLQVIREHGEGTRRKRLAKDAAPTHNGENWSMNTATYRGEVSESSHRIIHRQSGIEMVNALNSPYFIGRLMGISNELRKEYTRLVYVLFEVDVG